MSRVGGRQRGTPNKITRAFKDAIQIVYDDIGGHQAFAEWAREHPSEFYRIAARLIPVEVRAQENPGVTVLIMRDLGNGSAAQPIQTPTPPLLPVTIEQ